MANFLAELKSTTKVLRPTATVVRSRGGNITVERADLLSNLQHTDCMASAKSAQLLFQQLCTFKISATSTGYLWHYLNEKHHTGWSRVPLANTSPASLDPSQPLRALTFNVWFAEHAWKERQDALVHLLFENSCSSTASTVSSTTGESKAQHKPTAPPPLDIVLLQEVTLRFLQRLQQDPRIQQTYSITDSGKGNSFLGKYGNIVLVHKRLPLPNVVWVKFPGKMGRRGLVVEWENLAISTVHLESLQNASTRMAQIQLLCHALPSQAIVAGDFNIAGSGPYANEQENAVFEDLRNNNQLQDVSHGLGSTYDTQMNPMVTEVTGQPKDVARYDRILCRGVECSNVQLEGTKAIECSKDQNEHLRISDHFGLSWWTIQLTQSKTHNEDTCTKKEI